MAKVSKIERQKNNGDRYSIFIDSEYTFSLSGNDLIASGLHVGQKLLPDQMDELRGDSEVSRAYEQAVTYISFRQRTKQEVVRYLKQKSKYADDTIDRVIERLQGNALLDDSRFAQSWVADRSNLKPRSKRQLELELRQKGVQGEDLEEVLGQVDNESEIESAIRIAQKKLTRYPDQQKLVAYLMRQGFSYDTVKQALERIEQTD